MNMDTDTTRKSTWKTVLLAGCIVFLAAVMGLVVIVAMNWSRLTGLVTRASDTIAVLRSVQAAVRQKYDVYGVRVMTTRKTGVSGSILSVVLINPPFLEKMEMDGLNAKQKALEVAATARDALPPGGEYDNYEIILVREKGVGLTTSHTHGFLFRASDLPPPGL